MTLRWTILASDSPTPCGVESFTRRLASTVGVSTRPLDHRLPGLAGALRDSDALVLNLPIVAWKRFLLAPLLAALLARLMGRQVIVVLHEWADLDWKRRASYAAFLPLATAILMSSPEVARSFAASAVAPVSTRRRGLVPIPPNLDRPSKTCASAQTPVLRAARVQGRLIIGHFGSIYPKKQSTRVLDVAAALKARGEDPLVIFAGSFIKGNDRVEDVFFARVRALGLEDAVLVTGYIDRADALFGLFEDVDVFVYAFAEGLTARRGSVLACLAAGKPVVVNAPARGDAFDHHPAYGRLLASGHLRLTDHDADADAMALAVLAARHAAPNGPGIDPEAAWRDVLAALKAVAGPIPQNRPLRIGERA